MTLTLDLPETATQEGCSKGCVLAIVGSRSLAGRADAQALIERAFDEHEPVWFVSGGAVGVDSMSEDEADRRGYSERKTIHLPEGKGWVYYQKRDILIAKDSECLVCISAWDSPTHGAAWTAKYAEDIGKRVTRHVI